MIAQGAQGTTGKATSNGALSFDQKIVLATVGPMVAFLAFRLAGGLPSALAALTLFLGGPHVLATFGMYADPAIASLARSDPKRFVLWPALMVPLAGIAFGKVTGTPALWLLTALLAWQTYHFTKQNLGMFAFWCRARRMDPMVTFERRFLKATSVIGILGIVRAMDLVPSWNRPLHLVGLTLIAAAIVAVVATTRGPRMWALLLAAIFYAPVHVFAVDILGASFIYQAAHGAQYYLMVGETIRPSRNAIRLTIPLVLAGGALLLAITSPSAFHAQPWLFGLGKGIVAAHFVADASLWRLGNPKVRVVMKERFAFL